jgi:Kef-type K+ transport system membrane component KefB
MNQWFVAAIWIGLALAASLISIRTALSVALVEILVGVVGGNFLHIPSTEWTTFLAGFGSILLTFLAGAEVEPQILRKYLKESLAIGFIAFLMPFAGVAAYCYYVAHWALPSAWIGGIALSTTSVAVVYAVMVETGLNETQFGKLILAACFVNDLGTVLALGIIFANYNVWLAVFAIVTALVLVVVPRPTRWLLAKYGTHVSEPGVKFMFLLLFALGGLAVTANSEAVLPAYLVGLVLAQVCAENKDTVRRLRTTVFALLTPFYFLRAGSLVSLPAVAGGIALIGILLLAKVTMKVVGIWPLTKAFRFANRPAAYTTLLMSTGLTFGTISALFGYNHQIIDQQQYTILVTVVIATAVIPTIIAQTWFRPTHAEVADFADEALAVKEGE